MAIKLRFAEWISDRINTNVSELAEVSILSTADQFGLVSLSLPSAGVVVLADSVQQVETPPGEDLIQLNCSVVVAAESWTADRGLSGLYQIWESILQAIAWQQPDFLDTPVIYSGSELFGIEEGRIEILLQFSAMVEFQY